MTWLKVSSRFSFSSIKEWESKEIHRAKSHINLQRNANLSSQATVNNLTLNHFTLTFLNLCQHDEAILRPKLPYIPSPKQPHLLLHNSWHLWTIQGLCSFHSALSSFSLDVLPQSSPWQTKSYFRSISNIQAWQQKYRNHYWKDGFIASETARGKSVFIRIS